MGDSRAGGAAGRGPRPILRLRIEVVTNQCTRAPDHAGEQDADPQSATDCAAAGPQAQNVRIAEFQAFAQ